MQSIKSESCSILFWSSSWPTAWFGTRACIFQSCAHSLNVNHCLNFSGADSALFEWFAWRPCITNRFLFVHLQWLFPRIFFPPKFRRGPVRDLRFGHRDQECACDQEPGYMRYMLVMLHAFLCIMAARMCVCVCVHARCMLMRWHRNIPWRKREVSH